MIDSMKLCDAECFDNPRFELVSPYIIDAPSNMFDPAILNPATDLLIIHPAWDDNYPSPDGMGTSNFIIDSFLKHRLAIMNFVRAGGNLLYISDSHLNISSLPSMFMTKLSYSLTITAAPSSNRNFINETSASINTSLAFTAPPPGSLIHLLNSTGDPVLFETESGKGTILISAFSPLCNTGSPPGSPIHYPVNINTIRYMIGAVYK
jgi:hypothetical protein